MTSVIFGASAQFMRSKGLEYWSIYPPITHFGSTPISQWELCFFFIFPILRANDLKSQWHKQYGKGKKRQCHTYRVWYSEEFEHIQCCYMFPIHLMSCIVFESHILYSQWDLWWVFLCPLYFVLDQLFEYWTST